MMSLGTRPSGVKSAVVFGLVAFLTIAREPSLLVEPRFWAEEGTAFFQQAMSSDWHSLVWMPFRCNYFLFPRIATLLSANLLPLSYAPLLTTLVAFAVQMTPFFIILFLPQRMFMTVVQKFMACMIVLFLAPAPEIWLTSTNSHWHAVVGSALLLIIDFQRLTRAQKVTAGTLVVLFGLSGVPSNFVLPMYWLKHFMARTRISFRMALLATVACCAQLLAVGYGYAAGQMEGRLESFDLNAWLFRLLKQPVTFIFWQSPLLPETVLQEYSPLLITCVLVMLLVAAFSVLIVLVRPFENQDILLLFGCVLLLFPLMLTFSLNMGGGARYMYPPGVLLLLLFLARILKDLPSRLTVRNMLLVSLLGLASINGGALYLENRHLATAGHRPTFREDWPRWSEEVSRWKLDPAYKLRVHPVWKGQDNRITLPIDGW